MSKSNDLFKLIELDMNEAETEILSEESVKNYSSLSGDLIPDQEAIYYAFSDVDSGPEKIFLTEDQVF